MAFQNPLKSRWVAVFIGFLVGVFASSLTRSASSEDEKAETLILKQMLAIENIEKTQGREPSSKAEIDAEVGRWDDYALRVLTLQKTGKSYDDAFVMEPWHSSNSSK
jgi:hypothetical protein